MKYTYKIKLYYSQKAHWFVKKGEEKTVTYSEKKKYLQREEQKDKSNKLINTNKKQY